MEITTKETSKITKETAPVFITIVITTSMMENGRMIEELAVEEFLWLMGTRLTECLWKTKPMVTLNLKTKREMYFKLKMRKLKEQKK